MKQVVSFSGGKDSTAMLIRMVELGEKIDDVVYFDTGWEFPQMYDHIRAVEDYTALTITHLIPDEPFDDLLWKKQRARTKGIFKGELINGYGWPGVFSRWCTARKTRKLAKYYKSKYNGVKFVDCVGIAADEARRAKLKGSKIRKFRYPLIEWGWTEQDALDYCYSLGFDWGGLYKTFNRVSCWCCPLQGVKSFSKLRRSYPDLWERLRIMATETKNADEKSLAHWSLCNKRSFWDLEERFNAEDRQRNFLEEGQE